MIVIGGGISGLAAAWQLRGKADVTVLESDQRIGGKLHTSTIGGIPVDTGAESIMALRPEAVELAQEVGLGAELCDPATAPTTVWTHGRLRPMPAGHVLGIPTEPRALAGTGLLSDEGLERLCREEELPAGPLPRDTDISVAGYLSERIGQEAVDRLVEPMLGGVYAGRADRLSLRAAMPRLAAVAEHGGSIIGALRRVRAAGAPKVAAVQGVRGGTGRLPIAVAQASGARILTGTRARELGPTPSGRWRVCAQTADGPLVMEADAVILALPAYAAAELLRGHSPAAHEDLSAIRHANSAVITMAFDRARMTALPEGNGFLVPPVDGHVIKAASFLTNKWSWLRESAPGSFVLRVSIGRAGEDKELDVPDRHLIRTAVSELHLAAGRMGEPTSARVTRWDRSLPQYGVGHADRVERIREAVAKLPGIELSGAAYEGVGVAACVATGRKAARQVFEG
ncbi:protoporphyrinogen oxidase [Streptomyces sp. YC504]|uniref:Coproporphyrinogen III oxidase n=1 Tax=Streptomyces mesophilus TaxID=1775132 RepID=A0A6G4XXB7_9ACTN|nr:protoporphyrinogen oxidase [Streptomyces mesophilus]